MASKAWWGFFEEEGYRVITHLRSMWARIEIIGKTQLLDLSRLLNQIIRNFFMGVDTCRLEQYIHFFY